MSGRCRDVAVSPGDAGWLSIAIALLATTLAAFLAPTARANIGYEPAEPNPVFVAGIEFPHGMAVDQANHRVYVAVVSDEVLIHAPGEIRRFESNGDAAGTFVAGSEAYFSGVAVNPVTQGFYGAQVRAETPFGSFGTAQMDPFSAAGVMGTSFPLSVNETLPQIATDSAGNVFFPDAATGTVREFDSTGVLQEAIGCGGCPGGAFGKPVSVAVDSNDDLYVVDLNPDRVVKFTVSGGSYVFDSVLQSDRGAAAVGVDPSTDDVFVGDLPEGKNYHVVAYDSSGSQFDDFGAGMFTDPALGPSAAVQIAADETTHKLYLSESEKIYVFERVTIPPPSVTTEPASAIRQLGATLNAKVNANGHAVLDCEFEYVDSGDFQANGFANAESAPCAPLPNGSTNTPVGGAVSGLLPSTIYHFRATATSNAGSATGGGKTFETLPPALPTVTTESPLAVMQTTATLEGKINPHGGSVSDCHFEFGTSMSYGSSVACSTLPGPVTADVAEGREILGLLPGTAYHYRLVASTNAGTSGGGDVEFTTTGSAPVPDSTPAPVASPVTPARQPGAGSPPRRCRKGFHRRKVHGKVRCVKRKRTNGSAHRHRGQR